MKKKILLLSSIGAVALSSMAFAAAILMKNNYSGVKATTEELTLTKDNLVAGSDIITEDSGYYYAAPVLKTTTTLGNEFKSYNTSNAYADNDSIKVGGTAILSFTDTYGYGGMYFTFTFGECAEDVIVTLHGNFVDNNDTAFTYMSETAIDSEGYLTIGDYNFKSVVLTSITVSYSIK